MDRQHRRELKHDKFVDEVGVLTSKARDNQRVLIGVAAVALLLAAGTYGFFFYRGNEARKAQQALSTGIETIEAPVGLVADNPRAKFKTEAERTAAAEKQFKDIVARYDGTDASDIAGLYVARISAGRGDTATAKKMLQEFVNEHPKHLLVGSARYSLYQMRIDAGEVPQVVTELTAELSKPEAEMVLPGDSLLVLLAHAYEAQGNEAKTRETYKRLVTEFPDSPFALEAQRRAGSA